MAPFEDKPGGNNGDAPPPLASMTLVRRPPLVAPSQGQAGARLAVPPLRTAEPNGPVRAPAGLMALHAPPAPRVEQRAAAKPTGTTRGRGLWAAAGPVAAGLALLGRVGGTAVRFLAPGPGASGPPASTLSDVRIFPSLLPRKQDGAPGSRPGAPGARGPALLWFRSDLRLSDNEALAAANRAATSLVPVYCFDPREYGQGPGGFDRTGPYRAAFLLGALADLRSALRDRGSDLVVRVGRPEEVLPQLAAATGAGRVFCHGEATAEERAVEAAVARALDARGAALEVLWGGTLFHPQDLPFRPQAAPLAYGDFRAAVAGRGARGRAAGGAPVRRPVAAPTTIKGFPAGSSIPPGELPTLRGLGFSDVAVRRARADTAAAATQLRGGERAALEHMQAFANCLRPGSKSSDTAPAFSRLVSPWLAVGCLSPRTLYHTLREWLPAAANAGAKPAAGTGGAPAAGGANGMSWLLFELMYRDFFRFANVRMASNAASAAAPRPAAATAAAGEPFCAPSAPAMVLAAC